MHISLKSNDDKIKKLAWKCRRMFFAKQIGCLSLQSTGAGSSSSSSCLLSFDKFALRILAQLIALHYAKWTYKVGGRQILSTIWPTKNFHRCSAAAAAAPKGLSSYTAHFTTPHLSNLSIRLSHVGQIK